MRLSKRGEYGLRAMIALAEPAENGATAHIMQSREIAERERISAKYLEQILLTLKNAGLLHSRMGVGGGYYLARSASEISLGQIFRVLDGSIAPIKCVSEMAYEACGCPDVESCGLRLVMGDVRNAIAGILDCTSLADVLKRQQQLRMKLQVKKKSKTGIKKDGFLFTAKSY
jgi:Rrf2 family protein